MCCGLPNGCRSWKDVACVAASQSWLGGAWESLISQSSSAVQLYLTVQGRSREAAEHLLKHSFKHVFSVRGGALPPHCTDGWVPVSFQSFLQPLELGQCWFYWGGGGTGGWVVSLSCVRDTWMSRSLCQPMLVYCSVQSPYPFLPIPEIWSLRLFVVSLAASFPVWVVTCFWVILCLLAGECFLFAATCTHTGSHLTPQLLGAEFWLPVCRWVRIWPLCNTLGTDTAFCLKSCSARELYWWLRAWLCFIEYKSTCVNQRRDEICCAMFLTYATFW